MEVTAVERSGALKKVFNLCSKTLPSVSCCLAARHTPTEPLLSTADNEDSHQEVIALIINSGSTKMKKAVNERESDVEKKKWENVAKEWSERASDISFHYFRLSFPLSLSFRLISFHSISLSSLSFLFLYFFSIMCPVWLLPSRLNRLTPWNGKWNER